LAHQTVIDGLNFVAVHCPGSKPDVELAESKAIKIIGSRFTKALTNIGVDACSHLLSTTTKKSIVTHIPDSGEEDQARKSGFW
jgi:hypothetical protein